MRRKSHYTILGVARGESQTGIRAAYLRLAKQLHPDHAGEQSASAFREVQQAYDVLSDPIRKRHYDGQLERKRPARRWPADPLTRRPGVEPLVPEAPPIHAQAGGTFSMLELLLGQLQSNRWAGPRTSMPAELTVTLSPERARRGGVVTLAVPVRETCPSCGGSGIDWPLPCAACRQQGWVEGERLLRLELPPGIRSGTVVELTAAQTGGSGLRLRLLIDGKKRAPPGR